MQKLISLAFLASTAAAAANNALLRVVARQISDSDCESQGLKPCGTGCVGPDYTCCSDGVGGCPSGQYCIPNGCCDNGDVCGVGGGVDTTWIDITSTAPVPTYETTSIYVPTYTPPASVSPSTPGGAIPTETGSPVPPETSPEPQPPTFTGAASSLDAGFYAVAGLLAGAALI